MQEKPGYPENRLDIRTDAQGNITYEQNPVFAKYYFMRSREETEEELEDLRDRLVLHDLDEPSDLCGVAHDEWEDERRRIEEHIEDLEEELQNMHD